jgi:hypothetical protein
MPRPEAMRAAEATECSGALFTAESEAEVEFASERRCGAKALSGGYRATLAHWMKKPELGAPC